MKKWERSWKYVLSVLGIVVLVLLLMDFNSRMAELRHLTAEKEKVGAQATQLLQTNIYLETRIAYATSEQAVEEWGREKQRYKKAGDIPVIPMEPANSTPAPTVTPVIHQVVVDNWSLWMGLFISQDAP